MGCRNPFWGFPSNVSATSSITCSGQNRFFPLPVRHQRPFALGSELAYSLEKGDTIAEIELVSEHRTKRNTSNSQLSPEVSIPIRGHSILWRVAGMCT